MVLFVGTVLSVTQIQREVFLQLKSMLQSYFFQITYTSLYLSKRNEPNTDGFQEDKPKCL